MTIKEQKEQKLKDWVDDLIVEYPTHFYGPSSVQIVASGVRFTDHVWNKDHVPVYKMFDRQHPCTLEIEVGDQIFIGYQPYNGYQNLYITKDAKEWYLINQITDSHVKWVHDDLMNLLKSQAECQG